MSTDYFTPGPVDPGGVYAERRGRLDGFLGFLDGVSSVTTSIGRTVGTIADIRADWAEGQAAVDDVRLDREEREQGILLDALKVQRGDNITLYFVFGASAVALIMLLRN